MYPQQKTSILLVDNNDISRETIARLVTLKLPRLKLYTTKSIATAVDVCAKTKVDILIVDLSQNENLGTQFVKQIRLSNKTIQFILVTDRGELEEISDLDCNENCTITRMPIDLSELLAIINKYVIVIEG